MNDGEGSAARALMNAGMVLVVLAVVPGLANPFNVPKEALLCLLAAFACLAQASAPATLPPLPRLPIAALVAAIAAVTLAAVANGASPLASGGALRWWMVGLYFVALRFAYRDAAAVSGLLDLSAAVAGVEGVLVLLQVAFGDRLFDLSHLPSPKWRAFGTLGNPNWVGAFLAASLPLAMGRLRRENWWLLGAATIAAIAGGLVVTLSRSGWIAAGAGLLAFSLLARTPRRGTAFAAVAFGVVLGSIVARAAYGGGLATDVGRSDSIAGRWRMWRVTAEMIASRPLLGHGPGRFAGAYPAFQRDFLARAKGGPEPVVDLTDHPHDEYLYLAAEAGLLPLALVALAIGWALRSGLRPGLRERAAPAAAALLALCVNALADIPWRQPATTALLCVVLFALLSMEAEAAAPARRPRVIGRVVLALAALVALAQATRLLLVDRQLTAARAAVFAGDAARSGAFAARGLTLEPEHGELWALAAQSHAAAREDDAALAAVDRAMGLAPNVALAYFSADVLRRDGRSEEALAQLRWWSEVLPGLLRPKLLVGQMYAESGRVEEARAEWQRLLATRSRFDGEGERQIRRQAVAELLRLPMRGSE